jgi:hypothetical protein
MTYRILFPIALLLLQNSSIIVVKSYFQQQQPAKLNQIVTQKLTTIPFVQESTIDNENEQKNKEQHPINSSSSSSYQRRAVLAGLSTSIIFGIMSNNNNNNILAFAADDDKNKIPDTFDVDSYLRSGFVSNPMGVSGQAGKSRPETGMYVPIKQKKILLPNMKEENCLYCVFCD